MAEGCVYATAMSGKKLQIEVFMLETAIGSRSVKLKTEMIAEYRSKGLRISYAIE